MGYKSKFRTPGTEDFRPPTQAPLVISSQPLSRPGAQLPISPSPSLIIIAIREKSRNVRSMRPRARLRPGRFGSTPERQPGVGVGDSYSYSVRQGFRLAFDLDRKPRRRARPDAEFTRPDFPRRAHESGGRSSLEVSVCVYLSLHSQLRNMLVLPVLALLLRGSPKPPPNPQSQPASQLSFP